MNAEILRLFEAQANDLVGKLQSILEARDSRSWKEVTHTIKGAARGIGAFAMADAAAVCEQIDLADAETAALPLTISRPIRMRSSLHKVRLST